MTTAVEAQRQRSLEQANAVRGARSELKAALASGRLSLAEVLEADREWVGTMRISTLLLAVRRLGPVKVRRALDANRISPSLTLEHFPQHRRQQLLKWLRVNCPRSVV
jgi:hypothetical protein